MNFEAFMRSINRFYCLRFGRRVIGFKVENFRSLDEDEVNYQNVV